jgi:hypothetical protein
MDAAPFTGPTLARLVFVLFAALCAVAQLFIIRAVWRTQTESQSASVPAPRRGWELFWAVLPGALMFALFAGAFSRLPT